MSANGSFDSLADTLITQPANAQESARNNIIKEMVETERKYVQDLEIMQVSPMKIPITVGHHRTQPAIEILNRPRPSEPHGSRHDSPPLPWSQQASQLPTQIPHPA